MIYVKLPESIPASVQMTYVSNITCESIPTSVHMIYVSKITCESIPTHLCKYTNQCSDGLCK